ncbi:MATE family efflux transporter [Ruminiclostridium josui]|uniref:MATE family efflux transporter n=1 Tax=Ruminiclostridium josui TaxID=1499 RepID=UPI000466CA6E|nr:MATE family efflux transporter [Ruminiclostridium josui]
MDNTKLFIEEKVWVLLLKFSLPAIIGTLINALYNIIDRIFIGNSTGSLGIAGITIGFPIMMIVSSFAALVGSGATTLVAINLGQKKIDEAEKVIGNAFMLLIIISLLITIPGLIFLNPVLKAFGASDKVLPFAREYMIIIMLGTIFQLISLGMNNFIRATGKPKKAMATLLIGAVLNTILAPIFIFGFKWGMKGAALATVVSQLVSAAWVLSHFLGKNSTLKIYIKNFNLQSDKVKKIFSIGSASFIMQVAASIFNVIMNTSVKKYGGDTAISAMGAANSIFMLIIMPLLGINLGAQPIIGYNFGAKSYKRVKETLKCAIIAATGITVLGFLVTRIFPGQLMSAFNGKDKEFVDFGKYAMSIFMLGLPILGFQFVGSGYFQSIGKYKQAMFLTLSRQIIFLVPLLFILPIFFKMNGVLFAVPVSDLLSSIITGLLLFKEIKGLNRIHNESTDVNGSISGEVSG